jgi:glutaredoxin 3
MLGNKGIEYKEIAVDGNPSLRQEMMEKSGRNTVPQIWINEEHIGGCDELIALQRSGDLDKRLK